MAANGDRPDVLLLISDQERQHDWPSAKLFGPDADFADHDHELHDLQEDAGELVNLAMARGRRDETREWFDRLRGIEAEELVP